jgi:hypothetical protein
VYRMVDVLVQDEVGNRLYVSPFFLLLWSDFLVLSRESVSAIFSESDSAGN